MAIKLGMKDGKDYMASYSIYNEIKAINKEERAIEFVASDETMDRDNEVIRANGWNIKNYKKNQIGLWAHDHHGLPIWRGLKTWVEKEEKQLRTIAQFTNEETGNALGEAVFRLFENKFLNSVSVGFIGLEIDRNDSSDEITDAESSPKTPRRIFLKQELLEISAVPVPANPGAGIARDISEFDSSDIRKELDWMKTKGVVDELAYTYLTGTYNFLEERKSLYFPVHQCKHDSCEGAKSSGECEYNEIDIENEKSDLEQENEEGKQFEVQTLIFPKTKWDNLASVKSWAKENDFRSDKVDETEASWRLRQADPDVFVRLRTICINPNRNTSMDECKVKAVGGPKKRVEEMDEKRISGKKGLSIADRGFPWAASNARKRIAKWASSDDSGDKDKIDWKKFGQGFIVLRNEDELENMSSYILPFADIIDGEMKAVPRGVFAASAVLMGARGGVELSDADRKGAMKFCESYYHMMDMEAPWVGEGRNINWAVMDFQLEVWDIVQSMEDRFDLLETRIGNVEHQKQKTEEAANKESDSLLELLLVKEDNVVSDDNAEEDEWEEVLASLIEEEES